MAAADNDDFEFAHGGADTLRRDSRQKWRCSTWNIGWGHGLEAEYKEQAVPGQIYSGVRHPMLRGYRLLILATAGLTLIAASPPRQSRQAEPPKDNKPAEQALRDIAAALQDANKPDHTTNPCPQNREDRTSDLCAQWKAADAAGASALWTERTFYLAIFGLVVGFLTLIAAGAAAAFAKKAADHTETGAQAAKDAVASGRAWMLPEKPTIAHFKNTTMPEVGYIADGLGFSMTWQNYGQSPALDCKFFRKILVLPLNADVPVFEPDYAGSDAGTVIAQGSTLGDKIAALDDNYTKAFREQRVSVFFYSSVRYKDTFQPNETRQSAVCLHIQHGGGTTTMGDGKPREAITFTHVGSQNGAD